MKLYSVTATYHRELDGEWDRQGQVPSFLVSDQHVQSEEDAMRWGERVLKAGTMEGDKVEFFVCAVEIGEYK